jgi:hypothetical protein
VRGPTAAAATVALCLSLAAPAAATPSKSQPAPPVSGDTLVETCYHDLGSTINTPEYAVCRGLQAAADAVAAQCRVPLRDLPDPAATDDCQLVDGRAVSEAAVSQYRKSWVHRALRLQQSLDDRVPLYEAQIPGTHNSFNASSYYVPVNGKPVDYYPTLTNQDPNQVYSITDQLRMDIRGVEIDLHWVPSLYGSAKTDGYWVDVCHGQSTAVPDTDTHVHVGCTIDRSFQSTLAELRTWLRAHRHQFLLIYLENQLDNSVQGHNIAARLIHHKLGKMVYRPPSTLRAGHCKSMPYGKTRHQLQKSGRQVLLVGNCGPGNWNHWVFTRGPKWNEGGNPTTYDAKDCAADRAGHEAHSTFRRWFEESPFLEAIADGTQKLTAPTTKRMVSCGVNLTGWDQLTPKDGRLKAFVWSWAKGEPAAHGRCAYQAKGGRFRSGDCHVRRHAACVDHRFDWHVTRAKGPAARGQQMCAAAFPKTRFGVPPDGYRNAQLKAARPKPHQTVWLNYRKAHGHWHAGPGG